MQVSPREDRRDLERCPLCRGSIASGAALATCESCGTVSHAGCVRELSAGVCPVQGCQRTTVPVRERTKAAAQAPRRVAWWVVVPLLALVCATFVVGKLYHEPILTPHEDARMLEVEPPPRRPEFADVSHVLVGQRYTFRTSTPGGPSGQVIYEVRAVGPDVVEYAIQSLTQPPAGEPTPTRWRHDLAVVVPVKGREVGRERVVVGALTFDAVVVEDGPIKAWVHVRNGVSAFPPVLRITTDGQVTMELVRIDGP